jgi:hypothetical protein
MKVRSGFVSNSSSSSFAVVMSFADYQKACSELPTDVAQHVCECGSPDITTIGGISMAMICGTTGDVRELFGHCFEPRKEDDYGAWHPAYAINKFIETLQRYPNLTHISDT